MCIDRSRWGNSSFEIADPAVATFHCRMARGSFDGFGLYITLGSYSRSSIELERNRAKLRVIDGEQFVELVLEHYPKLAPRFRSIIPLKQIYVPDLPTL